MRSRRTIKNNTLTLKCVEAIVSLLEYISIFRKNGFVKYLCSKQDGIEKLTFLGMLNILFSKSNTNLISSTDGLLSCNG